MTATILSDRHRHELEVESAITPEIIAERGYYTATTTADVPDSFADYQRWPGLVIPIRDTTGRVVTRQLKADEPRLDKRGKPIRYDTAIGGRQCIDVPVRSRPHLGDPGVPLWLTEGPKKVDSGLSHGIRCIIGLLGVYGFRGTNVYGGKTALPDWEMIAVNDREVVVAFDSDIMTKATVRDALERLGAFLEQRGARVRYLLLPPLPNGEKQGLDDFFAGGHTRDDLKNYISDELPPPADAWEPPLPLDDPAGPPFPVEALPGAIGAMVTAVAEETQTPPDMAATMALATISAAAGGKHEVVLPEQGWHEPVHIMTVVGAAPASRKSGVIRALIAPLVAYEREVQPAEREALAEWESRERVLQKALAEAEKTLRPANDVGGLTDSEAIRMAAVAELESHRRARPRITRLIADDITPEAAKTLLAEQGGAIAVMSPESTFLANTAGGRYAQGGAPNLDVILNGHAGDAIVVDRKGRPSEVIDRACLTLGLMVQPRVIRDLGRAPGFVDRGGAARLLSCIPIDVVGKRRIDVTPVSPETAAAWDRVIRRIAARRPERHDGGATPWTLALDPAAAALLRDYRVGHEAQMAPDGAYDDIRDWAGKQPGAVLRIAGLLHVMQHETPETAPISAETLGRAITIMSYYAAHARVMYRLLAGRSAHADARIALAALRHLGSPTTRREVHRKLHKRLAFAKADDLDAPLALLEEYGYLRRERRTRGISAGRPSESIELNPLLDGDKIDTIPDPPQLRDDLANIVDFVPVPDGGKPVNPIPDRSAGTPIAVLPHEPAGGVPRKWSLTL